MTSEFSSTHRVDTKVAADGCKANDAKDKGQNGFFPSQNKVSVNDFSFR